MTKIVQTFLKNEFDDKVGELTLEDLDYASKLKISDGTLLSWDELIDHIEKLKNETLSNETDNSSPLSFSKAWNALGTTGVEEQKGAEQETKENLMDLARSGQLTTESFQKTDGTDTFLTKIGMDAEKAVEEIQNLLSTQEKLSAFSQGLSGLSDAFKEFQENNFVSAETLNSMPDAFKSLKGYDLFSQIVGDPKSGTQKIQKAFDQIVSEYLQNQDVLSDATDSNKNQIITNLQQAGIGNAKELVNSYISWVEENKPLIQGASDEIMQYLSNNNKTDVNNFVAALKAKNTNYTALASTLGKNNANLIEKFGNQYGNDLANWISLLNQKQEAYNQFVEQYNNSLEEQQNYFNSLDMPVERAVANGTADTNTLTQNADKVSEAKQNMKNAGKDLKKNQQNINKKIAGKLAKMQGKIKVSGYRPNSPSGSNGNKGLQEQETKKSFNWLERRISVLTNKLDFLKAKLENVFSVKKKNSIIDQEIKKTNKLIKTYQKQAKVYKKQANKSARSSKTQTGEKKSTLTGKKGKKIIKQIQTGQIKGSRKQLIKNYGEPTANAIEEYQDYWDKYQQARINIQTAKKDKRELKIQKHQNRVDHYDALSSKYDAQIENKATAKAKNILEGKKIKSIQKSYNYQIKIAKLEKNSVKAATLLAQKWQEIAKAREQILQNTLDENANRRKYNDAAYENKDNAEKKQLIQSNISTYRSDNNAYQENINSAQKDVNDANNAIKTASGSASSQLKKTSIDSKTTKIIKSYLSSGKAVPDQYLKMAKSIAPKLYEKLTAYNTALNNASITKDALTKAQDAQKQGVEESEASIREEQSKSIQLDIDAANNKQDQLTAEYDNLTTAEAKNLNIASQLQQQAEIHKLNIAKIQNDIMDSSERNVALAKEEAEWIRTQREQEILKLQNLSDEQSAQYDLNQQKEANADTAKDKNKYEADSRKNLKSQYDYEIQIAEKNKDFNKATKLRLELEQKIEESYQKQIENIKEEYDLLIGMNDAKKSTIDSKIAALQANGYGIGTEVYEQQMVLDRDSYRKSLEEIERISAEMPNLTDGALKQAEIDLEAEKQKAWGFQKALGEAQQTINDINLSKIERIGTYLEYDAENLEYIQGILSHSDFTLSDKDIGGLTTEGLANIAVTFAQMSNNSKQIANIYDQIAEKRRQLEKSNVKDDQLVAEIDELIQKAHDMEKANYDFGESIKTMVIDSLNSLSDALDENISKYKEALQARKDLYDYQQKIADQLKSITSLEKQLTALQGSDTEEARARIQNFHPVRGQTA